MPRGVPARCGVGGLWPCPYRPAYALLPREGGQLSFNTSYPRGV